jgi:Cd2+/Zn2+-exporting ATPase
MTKKQKKILYRILISAAFTLAAALLTRLFPLPWLARLLLFCLPYFLIGWDVLRKAVLGILHGEVFDENFLMAVATVGAMALGEYAEGVAVMLFYQTGELFQSYAVGKSRRSIADLMDIRPDSANLLNADDTHTPVDPETVAVGSIILVQPGERVPLDGVVLEGSASMNTSALTGESVPRTVESGSDIISGCIDLDGTLKVRTTKAYGESTVAKILDLVENSSLKKAKAENFITKFARYYTPAVCFGALALAILPPLFVGGWMDWISRALTFLVISCPCALVISIPLSFFGGIGGASRCGILIKGGNYLEALAHTGTVVFDKTGTLTKGVFAVSEIHPAAGCTEQQLLETAALAELHSGHPISKSLRAACAAKLDPNRVSDAREIAGRGAAAVVDGRPVLAGNAALMKENGVAFVPDNSAGTVVYLAQGSVFLGSLLISDVVKPTSKKAMDALHAQNIRTVMLTGDNSNAARPVADELGIDEMHAGLLPADKVAEVERLLAAKPARTSLAFVGDGINDAPVLTRADIGIAMGALGSDAAIEAADVVLMDDDPARIGLAMRIARKCMGIVYQNIVLALAVKAIFLVLGALGIANMWGAVFADVGVMILAVLNATRMLSVPNRT